MFTDFLFPQFSEQQHIVGQTCFFFCRRSNSQILLKTKKDTGHFWNRAFYMETRLALQRGALTKWCSKWIALQLSQSHFCTTLWNKSPFENRLLFCLHLSLTCWTFFVLTGCNKQKDWTELSRPKTLIHLWGALEIENPHEQCHLSPRRWRQKSIMSVLVTFKDTIWHYEREKNS